jgi:hypothetical protein
MLALLAIGLRGHHACAERLASGLTSGWAVVPSTRGRMKLHDLVAELSRRPGAEVPVEFVGAETSRQLRPADWRIKATHVLPAHVLLIDDSWVAGAHSQSVAASLKIAGVQEVSIFTVARVLNPGWSPNRDFIRAWFPDVGLDWARCPWTGGTCP